MAIWNIDLRGRGRGQGWGQNRGQIYVEVVSIYYHAKFQPLAWKMSELWLFEILTFEAEVEVEAEVKTEARYSYRRSRYTTMKSFSLLAWKMAEL